MRFGALQFGVYLFFAGWVAIMTAYVILLLPETKGVPIEEMQLMWRRHWFWKRIATTKSERHNDQVH
jgi:hypothetical protein